MTTDALVKLREQSRQSEKFVLERAFVNNWETLSGDTRLYLAALHEWFTESVNPSVMPWGCRLPSPGEVRVHRLTAETETLRRALAALRDEELSFYGRDSAAGIDSLDHEGRRLEVEKEALMRELAALNQHLAATQG